MHKQQDLPFPLFSPEKSFLRVEGFSQKSLGKKEMGKNQTAEFTISSYTATPVWAPLNPTGFSLLLGLFLYCGVSPCRPTESTPPSPIRVPQPVQFCLLWLVLGHVQGCGRPLSPPRQQSNSTCQQRLFWDCFKHPLPAQHTECWCTVSIRLGWKYTLCEWKHLSSLYPMQF